jgi:hypothetical protein
MPSADQSTSPVLVLLGVDGSDKPHASRFPLEQFDVVLKAARLMQLHLVTVNDVDLLKTAQDLPEGKIFGTGRGLVPFVRKELYDTFSPLIGTSAEHVPPPVAEPPAGDADTGKDAPKGEPTLWDKLGVGDVVLAYSKADEGWYEAKITGVNDNGTLVAIYRDYPEEGKLTLRRNQVGLLAAK